jgi:hypothetical protein
VLVRLVRIARSATWPPYEEEILMIAMKRRDIVAEIVERSPFAEWARERARNRDFRQLERVVLDVATALERTLNHHGLSLHDRGPDGLTHLDRLAMPLQRNYERAVANGVALEEFLADPDVPEELKRDARLLLTGDLDRSAPDRAARTHHEIALRAYAVYTGQLVDAFSQFVAEQALPTVWRQRSQPISSRATETIKRASCLLVLAIVAPMFLAACGGSAEETSTTRMTGTHGIMVAASSAPSTFLTAAYCPDLSLSYPRRLLHRANAKMADWIDTLPQSGRPASTVFIQPITKNTYTTDPDELKKVLGPVKDVIAIPTVEAGPAPATAVPTVAAVHDPSLAFSESGRATATAVTAHRQATATTQVSDGDLEFRKRQQAHQDQLAAIRNELSVQSNALRSWSPPSETESSDIGGCAQKAAERFEKETGEKLLIGATDWDPTGEQQWVGSHRFDGVRVLGLYFYCEYAQDCVQRQAYWHQFFTAAGAASVDFLDPAQSDLLADLTRR